MSCSDPWQQFDLQTPNSHFNTLFLGLFTIIIYPQLGKQDDAGSTIRFMRTRALPFSLRGLRSTRFPLSIFIDVSIDLCMVNMYNLSLLLSTLRIVYLFLPHRNLLGRPKKELGMSLNARKQFTVMNKINEIEWIF
jgi:hypothetical protein